MTWTAILVLALGTYAMKAAGPVLLGRRRLPPGVQRGFVLLAVALLAALIALSTLVEDDRLHFDFPLVAGVAAAALAAARGLPFAAIVIGSAAVTAILRLV